MLDFLSSAQLPIHIKPVGTNIFALYLCQVRFKLDKRVQTLLMGNRERHTLLDFLIPLKTRLEIQLQLDLLDLWVVNNNDNLHCVFFYYYYYLRQISCFGE